MGYPNLCHVTYESEAVFVWTICVVQKNIKQSTTCFVFPNSLMVALYPFPLVCAMLIT